MMRPAFRGRLGGAAEQVGSGAEKRVSLSAAKGPKLRAIRI